MWTNLYRNLDFALRFYTSKPPKPFSPPRVDYPIVFRKKQKVLEEEILAVSFAYFCGVEMLALHYKAKM